MTDWNDILENIQHAVQAVDETQRVSEKLRTEPSPEIIDEFHQKAEELCQRLTVMNSMLKKGSAFSLEELTERLSHVFGGEQKTYRKTAQYHRKEPTKEPR